MKINHRGQLARGIVKQIDRTIHRWQALGGVVWVNRGDLDQRSQPHNPCRAIKQFILAACQQDIGNFSAGQAVASLQCGQKARP